MFALSHIFCHFFHVFEIVWINASHQICKKPIALDCLCFPMRSLVMRIQFSMFLELYGFLFHAKYVRSLYLRNICVFPYFSRTIGIHFSHVLKLVWFFASRERFKKLIIFERLCFPILSPYYENSLFLCFGNCMDFCFTQNM